MPTWIGKPLGPRVLVECEPVIDSVTARAAKAGLYAVVDESHKPKPTTGVIIALGTDPLIRDMELFIGARVSFNHLAGVRQHLAGKEYRILELQEIIMILPPDEPLPTPQVEKEE